MKGSPLLRLRHCGQSTCKAPLDRQTMSLGPYESAFHKRILRLEQQGFVDRLWRKDASLWKKDLKVQEMIRQSLGWLHVAEKMEENLDIIARFAAEVKAMGFQHVLHMGMGGSSLAALVFGRTFPQAQEGLPLTVLDTTDPTTILNIERRIPLRHTLFIAASKSGTTAEGIVLNDYFYAKIKTIKGEKAGENFIAITDPDTLLAKQANERGYRRTFLNFGDIGGRYSALSYFGLVPAALAGVDISELLTRALRMAHACSSSVPVSQNPSAVLGAVIGELTRRGRDKVTFLMPHSIGTLGMWLEQLLAESTGKEGTGVLPVSGESPGSPSVYGEDRLFVRIRLREEVDRDLDHRIAALRKAGHPLVTIFMNDLLDLGQEFLRWEIATAAAGAILAINAFDQPNVQESKENTNRLLERAQKEKKLPEIRPTLSEGPLRLFGKEKRETVKECLHAFFSQARPGDYVGLQAYLPETTAIDQRLQTIRLCLRDSLHLATTLGYGPRFLHSTGQFHKGGPNRGLFLQLVADEAEVVPVPGKPYSFGLLLQAQALGDLQALRKHRRRVVRVHLGGDVMQGLKALERAIL